MATPTTTLTPTMPGSGLCAGGPSHRRPGAVAPLCGHKQYEGLAYRGRLVPRSLASTGVRCTTPGHLAGAARNSPPGANTQPRSHVVAAAAARHDSTDGGKGVGNSSSRKGFGNITNKNGRKGKGSYKSNASKQDKQDKQGSHAESAQQPTQDAAKQGKAAAAQAANLAANTVHTTPSLWPAAISRDTSSSNSTSAGSPEPAPDASTIAAAERAVTAAAEAIAATELATALDAAQAPATSADAAAKLSTPNLPAAPPSKPSKLATRRPDDALTPPPPARPDPPALNYRAPDATAPDSPNNQPKQPSGRDRSDEHSVTQQPGEGFARTLQQQQQPEQQDEGNGQTGERGGGDRGVETASAAVHAAPVDVKNRDAAAAEAARSDGAADRLLQQVHEQAGLFRDTTGMDSAGFIHALNEPHFPSLEVAEKMRKGEGPAVASSSMKDKQPEIGSASSKTGKQPWASSSSSSNAGQKSHASSSTKDGSSKSHSWRHRNAASKDPQRTASGGIESSKKIPIAAVAVGDDPAASSQPVASAAAQQQVGVVPEQSGVPAKEYDFEQSYDESLQLMSETGGAAAAGSAAPVPPAGGLRSDEISKGFEGIDSGRYQMLEHAAGELGTDDQVTNSSSNSSASGLASADQQQQQEGCDQQKPAQQQASSTTEPAVSSLGSYISSIAHAPDKPPASDASGSQATTMTNSINAGTAQQRATASLAEQPGSQLLDSSAAGRSYEESLHLMAETGGAAAGGSAAPVPPAGGLTSIDIEKVAAMDGERYNRLEQAAGEMADRGDSSVSGAQCQAATVLEAAAPVSAGSSSSSSTGSRNDTAAPAAAAPSPAGGPAPGATALEQVTDISPAEALRKTVTDSAVDPSQPGEQFGPAGDVGGSAAGTAAGDKVGGVGSTPAASTAAAVVDHLEDRSKGPDMEGAAAEAAQADAVERGATQRQDTAAGAPSSAGGPAPGAVALEQVTDISPAEALRQTVTDAAVDPAQAGEQLGPAGDVGGSAAGGGASGVSSGYPAAATAAAVGDGLGGRGEGPNMEGAAAEAAQAAAVESGTAVRQSDSSDDDSGEQDQQVGEQGQQQQRRQLPPGWGLGKQHRHLQQHNTPLYKFEQSYDESLQLMSETSGAAAAGSAAPVPSAGGLRSDEIAQGVDGIDSDRYSALEQAAGEVEDSGSGDGSGAMDTPHEAARTPLRILTDAMPEAAPEEWQQETAAIAADAAQVAAQRAKQVAGQVAKQSSAAAQDLAQQAAEVAKQASATAAETASRVAEQAKPALAAAAEQATDTVQQLAESTADAAAEARSVGLAAAQQAKTATAATAGQVAKVSSIAAQQLNQKVPQTADQFAQARSIAADQLKETSAVAAQHLAEKGCAAAEQLAVAGKQAGGLLSVAGESAAESAVLAGRAVGGAGVRAARVGGDLVAEGAWQGSQLAIVLSKALSKLLRGSFTLLQLAVLLALRRTRQLLSVVAGSTHRLLLRPAKQKLPVLTSATATTASRAAQTATEQAAIAASAAAEWTSDAAMTAKSAMTSAAAIAANAASDAAGAAAANLSETSQQLQQGLQDTINTEERTAAAAQNQDRGAAATAIPPAMDWGTPNGTSAAAVATRAQPAVAKPAAVLPGKPLSIGFHGETIRAGFDTSSTGYRPHHQHDHQPHHRDYGERFAASLPKPPEIGVRSSSAGSGLQTVAATTANSVTLAQAQAVDAAAQGVKLTGEAGAEAVKAAFPGAASVAGSIVSAGQHAAGMSVQALAKGVSAVVPGNGAASDGKTSSDSSIKVEQHRLWVDSAREELLRDLHHMFAEPPSHIQQDGVDGTSAVGNSSNGNSSSFMWEAPDAMVNGRSAPAAAFADGSAAVPTQDGTQAAAAVAQNSRQGGSFTDAASTSADATASIVPGAAAPAAVVGDIPSEDLLLLAHVHGMLHTRLKLKELIESQQQHLQQLKAGLQHAAAAEPSEGNCRAGVAADKAAPVAAAAPPLAAAVLPTNQEQDALTEPYHHQQQQHQVQEGQAAAQSASSPDAAAALPGEQQQRSSDDQAQQQQQHQGPPRLTATEESLGSADASVANIKSHHNEGLAAVMSVSRGQHGIKDLEREYSTAQRLIRELEGSAAHIQTQLAVLDDSNRVGANSNGVQHGQQGVDYTGISAAIGYSRSGSGGGSNGSSAVGGADGSTVNGVSSSAGSSIGHRHEYDKAVGGRHAMGLHGSGRSHRHGGGSSSRRHADQRVAPGVPGRQLTSQQQQMLLAQQLHATGGDANGPNGRGKSGGNGGGGNSGRSGRGHGGHDRDGHGHGWFSWFRQLKHLQPAELIQLAMQVWLGVVVLSGVLWYAYQLLYKLPINEVKQMAHTAAHAAETGADIANKTVHGVSAVVHAVEGTTGVLTEHNQQPQQGSKGFVKAVKGLGKGLNRRLEHLGPAGRAAKKAAASVAGGTLSLLQLVLLPARTAAASSSSSSDLGKAEWALHLDSKEAKAVARVGSGLLLLMLAGHYAAEKSGHAGLSKGSRGGKTWQTRQGVSNRRASTLSSGAAGGLVRSVFVATTALPWAVVKTVTGRRGSSSTGRNSSRPKSAGAASARLGSPAVGNRSMQGWGASPLMPGDIVAATAPSFGGTAGDARGTAVGLPADANGLQHGNSLGLYGAKSVKDLSGATTGANQDYLHMYRTLAARQGSWR